MLRSPIAALALVATAVSADARAQQTNLSQPQPGSVAVSTPAPATDCRSGSGPDVVVCGNRGPSPYRIDPVTLDAMRAKEALQHPERVATREPPPEACGTVRNECSGDYLPIFGPVMKVVGALVNAANGEDWREPFRTGPDEYQLYQEARRKHARASVSVSVGASSGSSGPRE